MHHKPLLIFLFLFSNNLLSAQSWQPFPFTDTYHYTYNDPGLGSNDDYIHSIRVDSLVANGADTSYWFNQIARSVDSSWNGCWTTNIWGGYKLETDNIFGRKMIKKPGGTFLFPASSGDTIIIETQVNQGTNWNFQATQNVSASFDTLYQMTILGMVDSVKEINLSDGRQIILSKSHGFVQVPDFYPLTWGGLAPTIHSMKLWGIVNVGLGKDLPDFNDIFRIKVGDVVQYIGESFQLLTGATGRSNIEFVYKNISINQDSSLIHFERTKELFTKNGGTGPSVSTYYPPVPEFDSLQKFDFPLFNMLPLQVKWDSLGKWWWGEQTLKKPPRIHSHWANRVEISYESFPMHDTCENIIFDFESKQSASYGEGLGIVSLAEGDEDGGRAQSLNCYTKATDSLAPCKNIANLIIPTDPVPNAIQFSIFPNPAFGQVEIVGLPPQGGTIRLLSLTGKELMSSTFPAGKDRTKLILPTIPSGMYLMELSATDFRATRKLMVK